MSHRSDRELFEAAVADARPLGAAARDRVSAEKVPCRPRPVPLLPQDPSRPLTDEQTERPRGGDAGLVRKLRRGIVPPEARVDLHGLSRPQAFRKLLGAVESARSAGRRCLLVVHGRGQHSEQGAVIRPALAAWLAAPPLDAIVVAHCPARSADGGDGATYVLLRKQ